MIFLTKKLKKNYDMCLLNTKANLNDKTDLIDLNELGAVSS